MSAQEHMTTRTVFMESENGDRGSVKYLCKLYELRYAQVHHRIRKLSRCLNEATDEVISDALGLKVWRVDMTPEEKELMANPRQLGLDRQRRSRKSAMHWFMTSPLTRSGGVHRPYY